MQMFFVLFGKKTASNFSNRKKTLFLPPRITHHITPIFMNKEDIEVINIGTNQSFKYAGRVFHGLEELQNTAFDYYHQKRRPEEAPYVVVVSKLYPCFDFEDSINEDRYYQNYYFTMDAAKADRICEETAISFRWKKEEYLYPLLEPMFSMGKIREYHLPYIYYHGEGCTMQIVQDKNAQEKIVVIS